jgi:hypothetical protein
VLVESGDEPESRPVLLVSAFVRQRRPVPTDGPDCSFHEHRLHYHLLSVEVSVVRSDFGRDSE